MKLSVIAFRNIRRNKVRTALTLTAIAFVTMLIVILFSFIQGMKADVAHTMVDFTTGHIRIQNTDYEKNAMMYPLDVTVDNYREMSAALEKVDGVITATPRIQFGLQIGIEPEKTPEGLTVFSNTIKGIGMGLDFNRELNLSNLGKYLQPGSLIAERETQLKAQGKTVPEETILLEGNEVLLGSELAQNISAKVGDIIIVFISPKGNFFSIPFPFKVAGIVGMPIAQINAKTIFFPIDLAATKLGIPGSATEILLKVKDGTDLQAMISKIKDIPSSVSPVNLTTGKEIKYEIKPWTEIGFMVEWIAIAENSYNFIALFFFLMAGTVIAVTTMMVIFERMKEIGTMAAMGMTGGQMVILFFLEAFFLSVIASLIGIAIGIALVIPLTQSGIDFNKFMNFEQSGFVISNYIYPQLNLNSTIFVFFFSIAIASGISALFSRRAGKVEPIDALNSL